MGLLITTKTTRQIEALRSRMEAAESKAAELEHLVIDDIDRAQATSKTYTGNSYSTYKAIINELAKKYDGKSEWGCVAAGNIIDVRSAFIIGQGLNAAPADPKKAKDKATTDALAFVKAFMEFNDLDREGVQDLAKEAEIEGCVLVVLRWDEAEKNVSVRFISRVETNYTIIHPKDDYRWFQRAEWKDGTSSMKLEEPEFVYAKFGGRIHKINEPTPTVGKCLTEIESLSKALRDWREINRLFGAPVPHVECSSADEAKAMEAKINQLANNWKLRRLLVHTGKLGYLAPDAAAQAGIEREIITLVKVISGATGTPIHFLGMPGELNGRATADNLMELVGSSTQKPRMIWAGSWQQIVEKAIAIRNEKVPTTPIEAKLVKVSIPAISPETWARIADTWLPAYSASAISLQTFLEKIPGIDASEEMKRIAAEKDANITRFNKSLPGDGSGNDPNAQDQGAQA